MVLLSYRHLKLNKDIINQHSIDLHEGSYTNKIKMHWPKVN